MIRALLGLALTIGLLTGIHSSTQAETAPPTPYAGQERRDVKALSPEETRSLENGEGMGLAKAAELNKYPGPRHVLDLAKELNLSDSQRGETERLFASMHAEAARLGRDILTLERELDTRFRAGTIDEGKLAELTQSLGTLQGQLRASHLRAHLRLRALLTPDQIERYQHLRGYGDMPSGEHTTEGAHAHHH